MLLITRTTENISKMVLNFWFLHYLNTLSLLWNLKMCSIYVPLFNYILHFILETKCKLISTCIDACNNASFAKKNILMMILNCVLSYLFCLSYAMTFAKVSRVRFHCIEFCSKLHRWITFEISINVNEKAT